MDFDTKDHIKGNIVKIEAMLKGLDTQIRFNPNASNRLNAAYNNLRIAADNMKEAIGETR